MDVGVQDLTFKLCYVKFTGQLPMYEHCTHNNEQFDGSLIKIKLILNIFFGFPSVFQLDNFFCGCTVFNILLLGYFMLGLQFNDG